MSIQKLNKCTSVEHIAFSPAFANIMLGVVFIMEWINNEIAKPAGIGRYLVILVGYGANPMIEICDYRKSGVEWSHSGFGNVGEYVKYWMPLPKLVS